MSSAFASGNWVVRDGSQAAFVESWSKFLEWTAGDCPGLRWATLLSDQQDGRHFVSVAEWCCQTHRDAWKTHPDFPVHVGACRTLCDEFRGSDYAVAAAVGSEPATARSSAQ